MSKLLCAILLISSAVAACAADVTPKVTLDFREAALKDVVAQMAEKFGVAIVLDPKAEGKVTASLQNADLNQALDAVTIANKLTWKKLRFAKPDDSKVTLEQLKSSLLALASMPVMGLAVEDPAAKTSAVFARDVSAAPDVSSIQLPAGYSWSTAYVIFASEGARQDSANAMGKEAKSLAQSVQKTLGEIAALTPEERRQVFASEWIAQMSMTPEIRQELLRDRMAAVFTLDQTYRDQIREDMHRAFHMVRDVRTQAGEPVERFHGPDHQRQD